MHARSETLDSLMTDVPDLVRVAVISPIGNSIHSSLSAVISMAQAVPNVCFSRKVFQKHQVNWNADCGTIQDQPGSVSCGLLTILLSFLTSMLVGCYLKTKVISVHNKN